MDHDQFWSANGSPSLAPDGFHDYTLPSGLIDQPLPDNHPTPWTLCQGPAYPSRLDELAIHTQHSNLVHACGMPSPAPTAPASSPPEWPKHDVSSISASWAPMSPTSPTVGESTDGEFHPLNMLLYAAGTATPPSLDSGLHDWRTSTSYLDFDPPYPSISAPPASHGIFGDFSTHWTGRIPPRNLSTEPFPEQGFGHALAPDTAGSMPGMLQTHSTHLAEPLLRASATYPHPSEPRQRQKPPSKRARSSNSADSTSTRQNSPKSSVSPSPSPPSPSPPKTTPARAASSENNNNNNSGPSLRTAARRFKRPMPLPKPGESPEHRRARTNHNLVEQQYRHRLHARFEALLEVLPEGIDFDSEEEGDMNGNGQGVGGGGEEVVVAVGGGGAAGSGGGSGKGSGGGGAGGRKNRRMSKVDVLSKAAKVIKYLESDYERVRREVEMLRREREVVLGGMAAAAGR